jgi:hypothetical protein
MSIRSFRQILVVALSVFSSSLALARTPPSLAKLQQAAAHATQEGGGYRDINWRFGVVPARSPQVMRAAGGYRDINYRFPSNATLKPTQTASNAAAARWR